MARAQDLTALLRAWRDGDENALNALVPLVYEDFRRMARRCLYGERANRSIQATALVHEAFLRLVELQHVDWQSRTHLLAMTARVMRRVLVDIARSRRAGKRGGNDVRVSFDERRLAAPWDADVIRLNDALQSLAMLDDRKSQVVELRFFGGLTIDEVAAVLHISSRTAKRDWQFAQAWLRRELRRGEVRDA